MSRDLHSEPGLDAVAGEPAALPVHLICCRPNAGLCGSDLTLARDIPANAPVTCAFCDLIDEAGAGCGARFCGVRQWLRQWAGWWLR